MLTVIKHSFLHYQNIIQGAILMLPTERLSFSLEESQKRSLEEHLTGEKLFLYKIFKEETQSGE